MTTDNTTDAPTADQAEPGHELVIQTTGEVIDLDGPTDTLAATVVEINDAFDDLRHAREVIVGEVTRRMDRANERTATVGDYTLKTNAPTTDAYDANDLRAAFAPLIEDGTVDVELVDKLTPFPEPAPPRRVVAKVELNKLKKVDADTAEGRAILHAIGRARVRTPNKRSLSITVKAAPGD